MKRLFHAALVAGGMLAASVSTAGAATVTWLVSGSFHDGGRLSGQFTYDDAAGVYSDITMTVTQGSGAFGDTDFSVYPGSQGRVLSSSSSSELDLINTIAYSGSILELNFSTNLDVATNYITIIGGQSAVFGYRSIASASGSVIPLPAGVWLLLSALGGLGFAGWRKKWAA